MILRGKRYICACLAVMMLVAALGGCGVSDGNIDEEKVDLINKNQDLKRDNEQKHRKYPILIRLLTLLKNLWLILKKPPQNWVSR